MAVGWVGWRGVSTRPVRVAVVPRLSLPSRDHQPRRLADYRFSLSLRDVEELLAERGVTVTYETIRAWCSEFRPGYAAGLRRRRAGVSDKWHLDEVQLKIKGERHWLWRAVDKHGVVLDILIQQRRDQCAAETFLRCMLAAAGPSRV